jgi:hypothetical protein
MNSIGVKLPIAQEFGKKSINLHHFGTKYSHPTNHKRMHPIENRINQTIEKVY